jgi:hypothetical protein
MNALPWSVQRRPESRHLDAHGVRVERVADEACGTLAAGAFETPRVVSAGDGLLIERGVVQRRFGAVAHQFCMFRWS